MAVWFTSNRLTENAPKCKVMTFGLGEQQCIKLMKQKTPRKATCRYLGLRVDAKMRFTDRIDDLVRKLNRFHGLLY